MNNKINVVLADESPEFRRLIRERLDNESSIYVSGEASSGEELVRLAELKQPDLIVTDTVLSGLDGLEAIRRIRENPGTQPDVFVVASFVSPQTTSEAAALGVDYFLLKPCDSAALVERIKPVSDDPVHTNAGVRRHESSRPFGSAGDPRDRSDPPDRRTGPHQGIPIPAGGHHYGGG